MTHNVHGEGDAMHEGQFDIPAADDRVWLLDDDPDYCNRRPLGNNDTEYIRASKVDELRTTARKEARVAAFREAIKWAAKVETVKRTAARDAASDDEFAAMRLAHEADGAKRVVETLEAAANKEGAEDGR